MDSFVPNLREITTAVMEQGIKMKEDSVSNTDRQVPHPCRVGMQPPQTRAVGFQRSSCRGVCQP